MFTKEKFSERLREARKKANKTQEDVAQAMGVTIQWVSDIERERRTTTPEKLAALCEYYGISADYLLGLKDEP